VNRFSLLLLIKRWKLLRLLSLIFGQGQLAESVSIVPELIVCVACKLSSGSNYQDGTELDYVSYNAEQSNGHIVGQVV
jgi:hypothetical protein